MKQSSPKHAIARVVAQYRGKYRVLCENNEFWAEVTGKIMYAAISQLDYPVVGDLVKILELGYDNAVIEEILPRRSLLKRKAAGKDGVQPIAANVDIAFIVQAIDRDFNLNRFERYLILIKAGKIAPVIVLNKTDLISKAELEEKIAQVRERFPSIEIVTTSTSDSGGIENLHKVLKRESVYCFLGSSGVGKSSIINKLLGKELLKTKEISLSTKKGKHTTTHRELFTLSNGSMIIDNPGIREVGVADAGGAVDEVFGDILTLAAECKFSDCTHCHEAGCAVISAVESGQISKDQYANYIKLKKESDFYAMSSLEKRRKDKSFGKMVKTAMKQIKGLK
ncbi:MAG: ribosome small subunit-dependent GTPase A [Candidatus Saganbacteria bacterium]|nr:ribosome small subunit-dependent GTPase A [Candidatus Saganbacteria bacterium]